MIASTIILLLFALAYATITDLRCRRIPNKLTFPMLLGGLVLRAVVGGWEGFVVGLGGAGVALAIMGVPFALNWMGAGDVKLAMVVGVMMGPSFVFVTLLVSAIVAGGIALGDIVRQRQLFVTAQYLILSWRFPSPEGLALKGRLPYAPAMSAGSMVALATTLLGM